MTDARFDVSIGTSSSTDFRDPDVINLRVQDRASGELLADINFTADEMWKLMRGTWMSDMSGTRSNHLERVGKKMITGDFSVPREVYDHIPYNDHHERFALCEEYVRGIEPSWETYSARSSNSGHKVITHSWVTAT